MEKTKKKIPALRFPGFDGEWDYTILKKIAQIFDGTHQTPKYVKNGIKFVSVEDIENIQKTKKFITEEAFQKGFKHKPQMNDILMTRITAGVIGATAIIHNNEPLGYYVSLALIRRKEGIDALFLNHYINCFSFKRELHKRIIHVAFPKKINLGDIGQCSVSMPNLSEQQKIADFLTAVDEKINRLTRKKTLLEQYKKSVIQKIFWKEIRLKDDEGKDFQEWEVKKLKDVANKINTKNKLNNLRTVLTNSAREGIVSQQDYFDKDIANQNNLHGYYVVEIDDFVYNPRISDSAPVGPLNRNKTGRGVMSPLYSVFRFKKGNLDYLERYFQTTIWHKYMYSIANYGARHDRMNITIDDFMRMPIFWPCEYEQKKIADFLTGIDKKIQQVESQLEKTKLWKKGLLQQLFV